MRNNLPRIIRNIIAFLGVSLIVGGTAMSSTPAAVVVTGVLFTTAAVTGMLLTRRG